MLIERTEREARRMRFELMFNLVNRRHVRRDRWSVVLMRQHNLNSWPAKRTLLVHTPQMPSTSRVIKTIFRSNLGAILSHLLLSVPPSVHVLCMSWRTDQQEQFQRTFCDGNLGPTVYSVWLKWLTKGHFFWNGRSQVRSCVFEVLARW